MKIDKNHRDVAQLASAPRSGRGGRVFESPHPDLHNKDGSFRLSSFFLLRILLLLQYFGKYLFRHQTISGKGYLASEKNIQHIINEKHVLSNFFPYCYYY